MQASKGPGKRTLRNVAAAAVVEDNGWMQMGKRTIFYAYFGAQPINVCAHKRTSDVDVLPQWLNLYFRKLGGRGGGRGLKKMDDGQGRT